MNKTQMLLKTIADNPDLMVRDLAKRLGPTGIGYRDIASMCTDLYKVGKLMRHQPDNLYYRYRIK